MARLQKELNEFLDQLNKICFLSENDQKKVFGQTFLTEQEGERMTLKDDIDWPWERQLYAWGIALYLKLFEKYRILCEIAGFDYQKHIKEILESPRQSLFGVTWERAKALFVVMASLTVLPEIPFWFFFIEVDDSTSFIMDFLRKVKFSGNRTLSSGEKAKELAKALSQASHYEFHGGCKRIASGASLCLIASFVGCNPSLLENWAVGEVKIDPEECVPELREMISETEKKHFKAELLVDLKGLQPLCEGKLRRRFMDAIYQVKGRFIYGGSDERDLNLRVNLVVEGSGIEAESVDELVGFSRELFQRHVGLPSLRDLLQALEWPNISHRILHLLANEVGLNEWSGYLKFIDRPDSIAIVPTLDLINFVAWEESEKKGQNPRVLKTLWEVCPDISDLLSARLLIQENKKSPLRVKYVRDLSSGVTRFRSNDYELQETSEMGGETKLAAAILAVGLGSDPVFFPTNWGTLKNLVASPYSFGISTKLLGFTGPLIEPGYRERPVELKRLFDFLGIEVGGSEE
uniref:Uncharacterized protein n=1 Tax=Paramoeba aestuarina TaxID=180227 RepID=A0A7S4JSH0_9EUKA